MKWIIDRIENNIAVCELENGEMLDVKISALPKGIREGDVINLSVDETETNERKERIDKLMNSLFRQ